MFIFILLKLKSFEHYIMLIIIFLQVCANFSIHSYAINRVQNKIKLYIRIVYTVFK